MSIDEVLVVGNGESRRCLNLRTTKLDIIGCNAFHREQIPNYLVCCDQRMVKEALSNPKADQLKIYTRERFYQDFKKIKKNKKVFLLPDLPYESNARIDQPIHWNSGPYAVLLACSLGYKRINIVGFDLYGLNNHVNNIYKGTDNYSNHRAPPVDPNYWIYQISKVFECFPDNEFKVYNTGNWIPPKNWNRPNVKIHLLESLGIDFINTSPVQYTQVV